MQKPEEVHMKGGEMDGKNGYTGNTSWEMALKAHLVMSSDGEPYRIIHLRGGIWASLVDRIGNNYLTLKRAKGDRKWCKAAPTQPRATRHECHGDLRIGRTSEWINSPSESRNGQAWPSERPDVCTAQQRTWMEC
jgi:hypothetical protein